MISILFALLSVAGALLVLWTSRVHYGALGLLAAMLGIASLYGLQGATFVSATYLLVQAGSVLLLFLFGALFTSRSTAATSGRVRIVQGVMLAVWMVWCLRLGCIIAPLGLDETPPARDVPNPVAALGIQLAGQYNMALELTGVVLLVALVGAVHVMAPRVGRGQQSE
ncbi:MAG: NADH-quinone oxidoreductase subunit J [Bacteroidota bacterium]